jgi:putative glycosyltransferase (TIGR04348 family)
MKISLITPANKQARAGNRTTAVRWARILEGLGHRVRYELDYGGADADLMVAVHAWRSASSIRRFRAAYPGRPLIVALAGTDIYGFQHSSPDTTIGSMELADRLVCLHDLVHQAIPARFAAKLHVIHQSAPPLPRPRSPSIRTFDVCVVGHLRKEKDSLRTAYAARLVPATSRLRVLHYGKPHDREWASAARAEMKRNPRYHWQGDVPGWQVRRAFGRCHAMVLSSVMEGGANVISEAVAATIPVIASRIDGSVGLLGKVYAGYYPVEDEAALAELLTRAETEPEFLELLAAQARKRAPLFKPARERAAWRKLLAGL